MLPSEPDVLIKRLDPGMPLPSYSHPGDAGADLPPPKTSSWDRVSGRWCGPGSRSRCRPATRRSCIRASGLAAKYGVTLVNAPGTVDAGYRGEIKVTLLNTDSDRPVRFNRGDRIAQLVIQRVERAVFHEVEVLPGSSRGEAGFGSTGGPACPRVIQGTWKGTRGGFRECFVGVDQQTRARTGPRTWTRPGPARSSITTSRSMMSGRRPGIPRAEGGPWDAEESYPRPGTGGPGQPARAGRPRARDPARHGRAARCLGHGQIPGERAADPGVRRSAPGCPVGQRPRRDRR